MASGKTLPEVPRFNLEELLRAYRIYGAQGKSALLTSIPELHVKFVIEMLLEYLNAAFEHVLENKPPQRSQEFWMESTVSTRTGEPAVKFQWNKQITIIPLEAARQIAFQILECSMAAENEAIIFEMFNRDEGAAVQIISTLRSLRDKKRQEAQARKPN